VKENKEKKKQNGKQKKQPMSRRGQCKTSIALKESSIPSVYILAPLFSKKKTPKNSNVLLPPLFSTNI
jgi:hypothetical protein